MILPKFLNPKNIKQLLEAAKIAKEVKASSKTPQQLKRGDFVVITLDTMDKEGHVVAVKLGKTSSIFLNTEQGVEEIKVVANNTIHILKNAEITLNDHSSYERDMHSVTDKGVSQTAKDKDLECNLFEHTTLDDSKVSENKDSALPASKKLSLRKNHIVAGTFVESFNGDGKVIEVIPETIEKASMAVVRNVNGKCISTEFIDDLKPITGAKRLSLKKQTSIDDAQIIRKLSLKRYGKDYNNLTELEKQDINDNISHIKE